MEGIISDSPEELRLAFFRKLKQGEFPHKISVWTRTNKLPLEKEIYFLNQRDYVFLKKQDLLPEPSKICLLITEKYLIDSQEQGSLWKMSAVISGSDQQRGEIAAAYYQKLIEIRNRKFLAGFVLKDDLSQLENHHLPSWMMKKITSVISELECLGPVRTEFIFMESKLILKSSINLTCPDWQDLTKAMTTLKFETEDKSSLVRVVLSKIIRDTNQIIIYTSGESKTSFYLEFSKEKNQKKYESLPKLIGVVSHE